MIHLHISFLDVFKFDPDYVATEEKYKALSKEILDTDSSGSDESGGEEEDNSSDEEGSNVAGNFLANMNIRIVVRNSVTINITILHFFLGEAKEDVIVDNTETNLTALRRTIYLTIHSSLDFEECAHKLMKMQLKPGQEIELCHMFLDCCAEMRTYEKFFGLLAGVCNHKSNIIMNFTIENVIQFFALITYCDEKCIT